MAEGSEVEERVDLDEDNYMEEIDDDVLEQLDEDVDVDGDGGSNGNQDEEQENSKAEASEQELSPNASPTTNNEVEDAEERPVASLSDEDREKFAQLLSLPPHGSEVFIGGLPRDVMEEDLRDLCEPIGEVFEVRLVKDKGTGESKGYAFVAFKTEELAQKAIEELHSKEFKGKTLRCSPAESKNRLFIGNIPKILKDDEFRKAIEEVGPGVDNIELIKDPQTPSRNRGFAFVLYYNNACAEYSRQKMSSPNFKLDGHNPTVTWADPKSAPDQSAASQQVKALYIKNIPENTSTEQLKELFQRHGEVTKVVMPPSKSGSSKRDFGFVHFAERSSALKAVKDSERYEVEGQALEVVLAKPQSDKKSDNSGLHPGQLAYPGYGGGLVANPFGSGYGVSPSYQQPMIYGRGPMPSGMQMVPMVLPDGRIGYVLQQPGVQMAPPHPRPSRRTDRNNGGGGHGGRGSSSGSGNASEEGSRNRRYRPY